MQFQDINFRDEVLDALYDMNFSECTPIQEKAIPAALEGRDILGIAQTGTGKTAAYLLPVIDRLAREDFPEDSVNCIVMVPTRELAQQIDRQLQGFSYFLPISSVAIYGGTDGPQFAQQERGLREGADIVIATPGRLISLLNMGNIDLSRVSFFILDEADRMLDMGFSDDILQIERLIPKERQTLLFSATMPPNIKKLADSLLKDPVEIKLAISKPAEGINQGVYICYEPQKIKLLRKDLKEKASERVIIFASTKQKVKELARNLRSSNVKAKEIHSDLQQSERDEAMQAFRSGQIPVLVATDILSRGIDIDDIQMVVNFDVPRDPEDYVHRVGRTARAGNKGIAITFVNLQDQQKLARIERLIEARIPQLDIPESMGETPSYNPRPAGNKNKTKRKKHSQNKKRNNEKNSHHRGSRNPRGGRGKQSDNGSTEQ